MTYLLMQLWFCLLLAGLIGSILGWLMRGGCKHHIENIERNWRERYIKLEKERNRFAAKAGEINQVSRERDRLSKKVIQFKDIQKTNSNLLLKLQSMKKQSTETESELHGNQQKLVRVLQALTSTRQVTQQQKKALSELYLRFKDSEQERLSLKQQLHELDAEKAGRKQDAERLQQHFAEMRNDYQKALTRLEQVEGESRTLQTDYENTRSKLVELEIQNDDLVKSSTELTQQREVDKSSLSKVAAELETARGELNSMQAIVNEERQQLLEAREKINQLDDERRSQLQDTAARTGMLEKELQASQGSQHETDEEIQTLRQQLEEANRLLEKRDGEVASLSSQLNKAEDSLLSSKKKLQGRTLEYLAEVDLLKQELERWQDTDKARETPENRAHERDFHAVALYEESASEQHDPENGYSPSPPVMDYAKKRHLHRYSVPKLNLLGRMVNEDSSESAINESRESSGAEMITAEKPQTEHISDSANGGKPVKARKYAIETIRGIGPGYGKRLRDIGIRNTLELVKRAKNPGSIKKFSAKTGVDKNRIESWVHMARLMQLEGIDAEQANLLEKSGVQSVPALAGEHAHQLAKSMKAAKRKDHRISAIPEIEVIEQWISRARTFVADAAGKADIANTIEPGASGLAVSVSDPESTDTAVVSKQSAQLGGFAYDVEEIAGISTGYGKKLRHLGINTTNALLRRYVDDRYALKNISMETKLDHVHLVSWINQANMLRIEGMNGELAELFYLAGIKSVAEIAGMQHGRLVARLYQTNKEYHRMQRVPDRSLIMDLINRAGMLAALDQLKSY